MRLFYDGPLGHHQDHFFASAGARVDFLRDGRYDPFSENDVLPQFAFKLGSVFMAQGDLSLAALLAWHYGKRSADLRGVDDTELSVHRLGAGAEGRYHLLHRSYVFARLMLGTARASARISDELSHVELSSNSWLFDGSLTAGAAFQLFGSADGEKRAGRFWLVAEGGYALSSAAELRFEPEKPDNAPERSEPREMGQLALSGATLHFGLMITL
jgi:hypothetical protein